MRLFYRLIVINIAIYSFISLNPYIRWLLPNEVFYFFFLITTVFLFFFIEGSYYSPFEINKKKQTIAIFIVLFITYFTTPLVHDLRIGHLLWITPFLIIIFYRDKLIFDSYQILKKIMVWIAVASIICWILNLFSIPLPYVVFKPDFRRDPNDYYRIYGLAIALYKGNLAVGQLIAFERITGVFAEPGHFGIYLGLLLAIEKFDISNWDNRFLLIAGMITFSTAFFGILFMLIIYRIIKDKHLKKDIRYIIMLFMIFIILGSLFKGQAFYELFLGDVFSNSESIEINPIEITDARVSEGFINAYDSFAKTSDIFWGYGSVDVDPNVIRTTNWRGLVFRFGIVGISIIISFFIVIVRRTDMLYGILLFLIAILVLLHRSYLLYTPWMYILLYMATAVDLYSRSQNFNMKSHLRYYITN